MDLYLKEVQMENFKSFGKKLCVPFFPGFTAITGPNGSGKSNIVDAILFVLGPRSSKVMRAGRLTDLIFNGGKKRKNPAKYCKVSLVFDNQQRKMPVDADNVVLTRMIKRAPLKKDPENYYSYFYVNDHAASFNEFVDLLTHARISSDGYNIVKQGDVTNLVKMGVVERRRILDDVAGISTFDTDIKRAEKEREDAERNLERIHIILNEITSQIRQLKKDRDAAYRYKELKDKYYETKAKIAWKKKQEIEQQIGEVNQQIVSYEKEKEQLEDQRNTLKQEYSSCMKELDAVEKKIGDVGGDEAQEMKEKIDTLRAEEIKIEEKINYSNDEIFELKKEQKELEGLFEGISQELDEGSTERERLQKDLADHEAVLKEKESLLTGLKEKIAQSDDSSMELTRELVKMREEYNEKQSELHELKLKRNRFTDKLEALELQIAELQETKSTYEFELKDIDWQKGELSKDVKAQEKQTRELEKQVFEKKKQESELTEQLAVLEKAVLRLQREQSKLQAEYDAVQSVSSKYNSAVHAVLQARDAGSLKGVRGTIAELAQVDAKFKTGLEIAAGMRMQSIVVDDDAAAASAISYLHSKNLGRATFLPLNKMVVGKPRAKALMAVKDESSQGFAFELVKFDQEFCGAFWYVFGDTVIVKSLSDARRLMGGVRLVDMKGNLIEASGAMIGGSLPKIHVSFGQGDRERLEEVTKELHAAIENQDVLSEELVELRKDLADIEGRLREIKPGGEQENQVKDLAVRRKEYQGKLDVLVKDLAERTTEKETLEAKKAEVVQQVEGYEQRLDELNQVKEEKGKHLLKSSKKEIAQQVRELEQEVSAEQELVLTDRSDLETLEKKMELIMQRKQELSEKTVGIEQSIAEYKTTLEELKGRRAVCQEELQSLMKVEEQMTGKVKEFARQRDMIYKKTVGIENELDKLNTRAESYLDLISRAKYRLPTLEGSIKELDQEIALYKVDGVEKKLPSLES
jgi:chromosome segregation protein